MIISFLHKGLRLYFDKGDASKLNPLHVSKTKKILTRLDAATSAEMLNIPGYGFHKLSGNLKDFWAVKVDKNYRIIFSFQGENASDVDYLDYH